MYQNLYRKYRPTTFEEVMGQRVIVKTLENAVLSNKISHAYLFTGPRGTGKTSIAKILSKVINCENLDKTTPCDKCVSCTQLNNKQSVDVLEIDAASNNGVDEIRELNSKVNLVPSSGKYKVYIIDEVHMLTTGAFNALLKTLEEPPAHIIFILATTEPHKIPATILSRCQRFDFKKLTVNEIVERLKYIVDKEEIEVDMDALREIAVMSDGGMRDSLSMLDQAMAYSDGKVTIDDVHEVNGTITKQELSNLISCILKDNIEEIFKKTDIFDEKGKDFIKLSEEIILFLRNVLIVKTVPKYAKESGIDKLYFDLSDNFENEKIIKFITEFNNLIVDMKNSSNPKMSFEILIIKLAENKKETKVIIEVKEQLKEDPKVIIKEIEELPLISEKLLKLKDIRINNTLCSFDKKQINIIEKRLQELTSIMLNPDYCEAYSIIIDGKVKAYGNNTIIFVYESKRISDEFNTKLDIIDKLIKDNINNEYKAISTYEEEWNKIKQEFNSKQKDYTYIEEPKNIVKKHKDNKIEELFDDIVEYIKE